MAPELESQDAQDTSETKKMPACLVPAILNAMDVIAVLCKTSAMVDKGIRNPFHIQDLIPLSAISIDRTVRNNLVLDDRYQAP